MQDSQHFFIIFSKILPEDCLVDALGLDYVLCYGVGGVFVDETLGHVVRDGVLWLLVEHQDEQLGFLRIFLIFTDIAQLSHKLTVPILVFFRDSLWLMVHI